MTTIPYYTFEGKNFSPLEENIIKNPHENKRYKLEISINDNLGSERCLIVLKNPSRACDKSFKESDKTINTVCQYFYLKKKPIDAKIIVIMNLFPVYGTDPRHLQFLHPSFLIDDHNKKLLVEEIQKADKIVFAWGTYPVNCKSHFEEMSEFVISLAKSKSCFQMKHPRFALKSTRPLHGQVWGYDKYELVPVS